MSKIDEIKKQNEMYKLMGSVPSITESIDFLLSQLYIARQTLETIGNITHRQDDITLQEINRHVNDALESFE